MPSDVGVRASRRLALAVVSLLLPALVLGYFGLRAVAERSTRFRTTYDATTVLLRDRLAAELGRLESELAVEVAGTAASVGDPVAIGVWLRTLSADRSWFENPFVLRIDGGIVAGNLRAGWPAATRAVDPIATLPKFAAIIREAEVQEFVETDLNRALQKYREALAVASYPEARAFALMRVGRTLFKLRRFAEGIAQYRAVLDLPSEAADAHRIPYAVNAFLQVMDGLEATGRAAERPAYQDRLLRYVVDHPWDLDDGYAYYLNQATDSSLSPDAEVRQQATALTRAARLIQWIRADIQPQANADLRSRGEVAARRLVLDRDSQRILIGFVPVPGSRTHPVRTVVGYEIRPEYIAGPVLASILETVDLGGQLRVEVLSDGTDRRSESAARAEPAPLAVADLEDMLPGWRVGLFHRDGRSIDQLVRRERWIYGTVILGMVGVLILGVALTMRASAREAELSRLKTEFVSNVSHELKTPLALIRMFGETLESGIVTDGAKRQEFYGIIRRESERLTHLINNVLDIARIDAGTKEYAFAPGDVVAVVRQAIEAYGPLFDRLDFAVETSLPGSPVLVSMDRDAIAQALVNLFQNAIKYSGDVKKMAVSVAVTDSFVRVSVADQGVGIAREDVPRIFDKHYRVHREGSNGSTGSGLGLAMVKHAVEAHGGRVEVESAPGRGSVFTLVVPALNPGTEGAGPPLRAAGARSAAD